MHLLDHLSVLIYLSILLQAVLKTSSGICMYHNSFNASSAHESYFIFKQFIQVGGMLCHFIDEETRRLSNFPQAHSR